MGSSPISGEYLFCSVFFFRNYFNLFHRIGIPLAPVLEAAAHNILLVNDCLKQYKTISLLFLTLTVLINTEGTNFEFKFNYKVGESNNRSKS